ncbi:glycoside hydrolase family 38 C-terminal domain-containing protein [Acidobacteriota bacterium]
MVKFQQYFRTITLICLIFSLGIGCQTPQENTPVEELWSSLYGTGLLLSGYGSEVKGETLNYHSPLPDARSALLVRSLDREQYIEWDTVTVPKNFAEDTATFIMLAGIDVNRDSKTFDVFINDEQIFSLRSPEEHNERNWTLHGKYGSELEYRATMLDMYDDLMGYLYLRWPASKITPGQPLRLRVQGESAGSRTWFMVFKHRLEQKLTLLNEQAILRQSDKPSQSIRAEVVHLGPPETARFQIEDSVIESSLRFGINTLRLPVPVVKKERRVEIDVSIGTEELPQAVIRLKPVAQKDIYLLHHSHVDIGYTHVQDAVKKIQWEHLETAINLADDTKDFPEGSRFKWNSEVLWPVISYLEEASEDKKLMFLEAVRRGQIGLDGLYANELTGLCRPEELVHFLGYARDLSSEYQLPVQAAMITDIPGYTWSLVPIMYQSGLRYLSIGPNSGHRIGFIFDKWADRPFYWESISGKERILCWVHGKGYSWFHTGLNYTELKKRLSDEAIFDYLSILEKSDYPYDIASFRYTIGSDNGPPDPQIAEVVKEWNEKYVSPRLIIATNEELFKEFEKRYGPSLPVFRGDFTGHWEDGAASSARETALVRNAAERLTQAQTMWSLHSPGTYPKLRFDEAWKNVILYNEHTWGSWNSISDPESDFTKQQWKIKQNYALTADSESKELMRSVVFNETSAAFQTPIENLDVYNTQSWSRSDIVLIPSHFLLKGDSVRDEREHRLKSQRLNTGELAVWMEDIPPLTFRRLFFSKETTPSQTLGDARIEGNTLSNGLLSIQIDETTGAISSLESEGLPANLVDTSVHSGLNDYLYVRGRDPRTPFGTGSIHLKVLENGPLIAALRIQSSATGSKSLTRDIRIIDGLNRIDVSTTMDRENVYDQEAVHLAWPFLIPQGDIRLDIGWGYYQPETEQLPGACKNYFSVQRWIDVSNKEYGVSLAVLDAPMVEIGRLTADPIAVGWIKALPRSQTFYSYVMNNYWETNYKASQEGPALFRYSILPHVGPFDPASVTEFGIDQNQPLLVLPSDYDRQPGRSTLVITPDSIVLSSIKPLDDGKTFAIRLFNPEEREVDVVVSTGRKDSTVSIYTSTLFESKGEKIHNSFKMSPHEIKTFLIELE